MFSSWDTFCQKTEVSPWIKQGTVLLRNKECLSEPPAEHWEGVALISPIKEFEAFKAVLDAVAVASAAMRKVKAKSLAISELAQPIDDIAGKATVVTDALLRQISFVLYSL